MSDNIAISINNISFSYDTKEIFRDLSMVFPENKISFIMGVNGSGKTTLFKIVCNFLNMQNGEIRVLNKSLTEYDARGLARVIAYVPQMISLNNDFLVKDYLAMGRAPYISFGNSPSAEDYNIVERYSEVFDIASLLDTNFKTLSGGQKQIVAIVRAMVQETPIIIMDEPMSALDIGKQADYLAILLNLKKDGKTVILSSHNPNHALAIKEYCDVCLLHEREILGSGNCETVLTKENIEKIFGNKVLLDEYGNNIRFELGI